MPATENYARIGVNKLPENSENPWKSVTIPTPVVNLVISYFQCR